MSTIREGLQFVHAIDGRMSINNLHNKQYALVTNAADESFFPFPVNGNPAGSTQLVWNGIPPTTGTYVNRRAYANLQMTLTFTGTATGGVPTLINAQGYQASAGVSPGTGNLDALRCDPLNQLFTNLTLQINNGIITQPLGLYSRYFQRYRRSSDDQQLDLSMSPMAPDISIQYADVFGTIGNPLGSYGNNIYDQRGAFSGVVITSNTPTSATATVNVTAPIMLSPMAFDHDDEPVALIGCKNFILTATLGGRGSSNQIGNSLWSHMNGSSTLSSITMQVNQATLFMSFLSPPQGQPLPEQVYYSFVLPTYWQQQGPAAPASTLPLPNPITIQPATQVVELSSIPHALLVAVDPADYLFDFTQTDVCKFWIQSISITLGNRTSILNSASIYDIYQKAVKNGCNVSWNQATRFQGLVLLLRFGQDIILPEGMTPGMNTKITLQISRIQVQPLATVPYAQVSVNMLVLEEGVLYIDRTNVTPTVGVANQSDYKMVQSEPPIAYNPPKNILGGAFGEDVLNFFKRLVPAIARPLYEGTKQFIPSQLHPAVDAGLKAFGKGVKKGRKSGGTYVGGRQMLALT